MRTATPRSGAPSGTAPAVVASERPAFVPPIVSAREVVWKNTPAKSIVEGVYGVQSYWREYDCWLAKAPGIDVSVNQFCMRISGVSEVSVDSNKYLYIQLTGCQSSGKDRLDDKFSLCGQRLDPGAFGAVVYDQNKRRVVASSRAVRFENVFGRGPEEPLPLVQISADGKFAWVGIGRYVEQGYERYSPSIYAVNGSQVVNVAGNIPASGRTETLRACKIYIRELMYRYTFNPSANLEGQSGYFPVTIEKIVLEGNQFNSGHEKIQALFDECLGQYRCSAAACIDDR